MSTLLSQVGSIKTTESYKVITTGQVLERFTSKGYEVTNFQAVKPRNATMQGFQKHLIRVSHPDFANTLKDARPEIVIVNSYNGSTALSMFLGAYRFVCANGLMVGTGFGGASIRHVGSNIDGKIDSGIETLVAQLPKLIENVNLMESKVVSKAEKLEFWDRALDLVIPETGLRIPAFQNDPKPIRIEDADQTAYSFFNVVQELVLKRGVHYLSEKEKFVKTRPVKSITRQVSLNRDLWDLAQEILVS